MKHRIKVSYYIDNDNMSDAEFEDQEERIFYIDIPMLKDFVLQNDSRTKKGDRIDEINFEAVIL